MTRCVAGGSLVGLRATAAAVALVGALTSAGQSRAGELVVYSSIDPEEVAVYRDGFKKAHPDIDLQIQRSSTGTTTARIIAEKDNPKHDVIFRLANTSLILFSQMGVLYPYKPIGVEKLDPRFTDHRNDPPHWVGHDAYMAAICYNTVEAKKLGLPKPTSWQDFINPIYRNQLAAPNPKASGTGFINLATFWHLWGEDKAFAYMDQLNENMKFYLNSGSAPCVKAGSGEVPIAMSWDYRATKLINEGAPIEFLVMKEGMGWDLEGSAIMKAAETRGRLADAKTFIDWTISDDAMRLYNKTFAIIGRPDLAQAEKGRVANPMEVVVDYDFEKIAENRNRLIEKWISRYEGKVQN
jgi:iron(III) transport system substrate-binding protein